jgi:oxygen-independent coproporphyrinogen III oxidase
VLPRHLYVHVPFCARRCSYCDFSIAVRKAVPATEYAEAVGREMDIRFGDGEPWELDTLYLGGGTPSKLGAAGVGALMDALAARVTLAPAAEVTLEANPEDVTRDAARAWRDAGITRLSLGSQSFDDRVLTWMHRTHDAAAIPAAVSAARAADIRSLSLDLIFALPESVPRDWSADLRHALALEPEHLSLYGLIVEPATALARWQERGQVHEATDDRYETDFLLAHETLSTAGFVHYEVSNYARPGHEAKHNGAYWKSVDYTGVGPSAHGLEQGRRRWNIAPYAAWMERVSAGDDPVQGAEILTPANRDTERVYLGLRTARGLHATPEELLHVGPWIDAGWGNVRPGGQLQLTPLGWLRLDALAADLTSVRSRY